MQKQVEKVFNKEDYLVNSSDRIAIRQQIVASYLRDKKVEKVLDIGCGDGSLSIQLLEKISKLTLVDIAANMLKRAKSKVARDLKKKVEFINGSFDCLDVKSKYDAVICVGVVAHVSNPYDLLSTIDNVLENGGFLIIETTPNPYPIGKILFPYYYIRSKIFGAEKGYKKNRMPVKALRDFFEGRGYVMLEKVRYSFPLPSMSHWPHSWKLRYTSLTLTNPYLSRLGTENILLFSKGSN